MKVFFTILLKRVSIYLRMVETVNASFTSIVLRVQ